MPNFFALNPDNAHQCCYCQHAVYDMAIRGYRCPKLNITITRVQYVSPNDCQQWYSMWLNDFKYQQRYGKAYADR